MRSIRNIVAATDFSPIASQAVRRAALLAKEHRATLRLVHALALPAPSALAALGLRRSVLKRLETDAHARLGEEAQRLRAQGVGVVPTLFRRGPLWAVAHLLAREDAELVVVGARGRRSLRNVLLGTTSERVIEQLRSDTLVVRAAGRKDYARPLVCVQPGPHGAAVLAGAARLLPDRRLDLLHVFEPVLEGKMRMAGLPDAQIHEHREAARIEARAAITALVARTKIPPRRMRIVLRLGFPPEAILERASRIRADVIVLGRARSPLADLVLGSVSRQVLREATCDVAVLGQSRG